MLKEYYYIRETDNDFNVIGYYGPDLYLCDNTIELDNYFDDIKSVMNACVSMSVRYPDSCFFIDSFVDEE